MRKEEEKRTITEGYNGYTNYETWLVNLWMDSDGITNYFGETIDARTNAYDLGKEISEYYDEDSERVFGGKAGLYADIVTQTLKEVNWQEIASGIIDSYR